MLVSDLIDDIIRREGGYVNNPADTGGPTKFGITQQTLAEWRSRPVTDTEVRDLTRDEAVAIYTDRYVKPFSLLYDMQPRLLALLADSGVQHGPGRAIGWLQEALGLKGDGVIGPQTMAVWRNYARNTLDRDKVYKAVLAARINFYGHLITKVLRDNDRDGVPDNTEFAAGWLKRVTEFL